tara:strand:- start:876 stop:1025 length:150 start_codon:yes stop_codon:yes gene_type:complete
MKIKTEDYLTVQNFARLKEVTSMTVYRWVKMGVVEGVKIDKVQFIKKNQ